MSKEMVEPSLLQNPRGKAIAALWSVEIII
jgi:hypothetical protein